MVHRNERTSSSATVQLPSEQRECGIWADLLGLSMLNYPERVSIIHFFQVDIMVNSTADGKASFASIDRSGPTKYHTMDTGYFFRTFPPRPACPKSEIENSIFIGVSTLLYSDYLLTASTWGKKKSSTSLKRKDIGASSSFVEGVASPPVSIFTAFMDSSESMKAGRRPEIPYYESFFGTSTKLLLLIKSLHEHGRSCSGNILTRRNNIVLKRLSLSVTLSCSRG